MNGNGSLRESVTTAEREHASQERVTRRGELIPLLPLPSLGR